MTLSSAAPQSQNPHEKRGRAFRTKKSFRFCSIVATKSNANLAPQNVNLFCRGPFMRNFVEKKYLPVLDFNWQMRWFIDSREAECIARTNLQRIRLGCRPVEIDLRLVSAAQKHSEEMYRKHYFDHVSPTPELSNFVTRARRDGAAAMSENIAISGTCPRNPCNISSQNQ